MLEDGLVVVMLVLAGMVVQLLSCCWCFDVGVRVRRGLFIVGDIGYVKGQILHRAKC